jgi:hypothetical protein
VARHAAAITDSFEQVSDAISPEQQRLLDQARSLIDGGNEAGLALRALGGIGIAFQCPAALRPPLARRWKDLDLVALSRQRRQVEEFLESAGLRADKQFNALHGRQRLNFFHEEHGYDVDVFVDRLVMCHTLDLSDRLDADELTLDPADLLLSKLQVVETNERDFLDILAIMCDHDVAEGRIVDLLAKDWGWYRTATEVLDKSAGYARRLEGFQERNRVLARLDALREAIELAPKSRGWRMRARIGDRVRWYDVPEEPEADGP